MTIRQLRQSVLCWIDNRAYVNAAEQQIENLPRDSRVDWVRIVPFIGLHVACLAVFAVGWSPTALAVAFASYFVRMFAITGFYHRYFSHRAFKTSRPVQFIFALFGAAATQRGPIWWSAHHRYHHVHSDQDTDSHSPRHGFWWSHVGWFLTRDNFSAGVKGVSDLTRFPELRWLDRFDAVVPGLFALLLFGIGEFLAVHYPALGTNGLQLVVWGFLVSTVVLLHVTLLINSMAHKVGSVRFKTNDDSRNNWLLALLTLGEGWHNNHHFYPVSARQGFYWWEIDITYYLLKLMSAVGLVWDLKTVPENKLSQGLAEAGSHA